MWLTVIIIIILLSAIYVMWVVKQHFKLQDAEPKVSLDKINSDLIIKIENNKQIKNYCVTAINIPEELITKLGIKEIPGFDKKKIFDDKGSEIEGQYRCSSEIPLNKGASVKITIPIDEFPNISGNIAIILSCKIGFSERDAIVFARL